MLKDSISLLVTITSVRFTSNEHNEVLNIMRNCLDFWNDPSFKREQRERMKEKETNERNEEKG